MTSKLLQTALYLAALPFVFAFSLAVFVFGMVLGMGNGLRRIWR